MRRMAACGARAAANAGVVGFLLGGSLTDVPMDRVTAFHQGLKEAGFVESQNVAIEYRSGEHQTARLRFRGAPAWVCRSPFKTPAEPHALPLLCARHPRPRHRRAAEKRDEHEMRAAGSGSPALQLHIPPSPSSRNATVTRSGVV